MAAVVDGIKNRKWSQFDLALNHNEQCTTNKEFIFFGVMTVKD